MTRSDEHILLLDWDGTLSSGRFWSSLEETHYRSIQIALFQNNKPLVQDWMLGKVTSEDVCLWLSGQIGLDRDALWDALIQDCSEMRMMASIENLLRQIPAVFKTILVTDNMDCFSRYTVPGARLDCLFNEIINSSDVGRMKNDENGKTLREVAAKFNSPIKHCVLIDDSEKTCSLFSALGGNARRTQNPQHTLDLLRDLVA